MSLSTQTLRRLPTIKQGLLTGLTVDQIANKLNVGHRTIDRDIHHWLESGEFETWIKEEWLRLHNIIIHENPIEAYRNITKLVSKMLTQKMEAYTEARLVTVQISHKLSSNETCNDSQPSNMNQTTKSSSDHIAKPNSTKPDTNTVTEHASAELEAEKPSQA